PAAQIPGIAGRRYPSALAGPRYPAGIPIEDEARLEALCVERQVDRVVFAYSDVTHAHVMHCASRALAVGCDVSLLGPASTMLSSRRPVIASSAVGTGCADGAVGWRCPGTRCPRGTSWPGACSASPRAPTWTPPAARPRSARNTSPTWLQATSSSLASTTPPCSTRPKPKPT